ncbi:MAG: cob(I)yrinic acid a,c-diamide adenosyltransferase [Eubacteriales bacterium]|nr:cob(I)yrinic acid a,c-diamide adenosyltransferase [Eubacteriales bacterium]
MDKLYTGAGDAGQTSTLSQRRISKTDLIIELLGSLDELSAALGVAKVNAYDKKLTDDIEAIQKKLIGVMGEVAGGNKSVTPECPCAVEKMCDEYQCKFEGFTISGENPVSAHLSLARTIARRAERNAVKANQLGRVQKEVMVWLNRLSDLLYAMSQYAAKDDAPKPETGAYRPDVMSLGLAKELSLAVEQYAASIGVKAVVAIVNAGANLVLLHATDDSYIASRKIAYDKAYTSVSLKMATITALKETRGGALDGLTAGEGICLLGGGEPLKVGDSIIGAIGVSGGTAEQDTNLARFAAEYLLRRQTL